MKVFRLALAGLALLGLAGAAPAPAPDTVLARLGPLTVSAENTSSKGRRPTRSDNAPITGSQMKLDRPTQNVTSRLAVSLSLSTLLPKVGV